MMTTWTSDIRIPNARLLWTNGRLFYLARGMRFWGIDAKGERVEKPVAVGSRPERLIAYFRLSRQLLRSGIHHLAPLPDGNVLVVIRKRALLVDPATGKSREVFRFPRGNKPAHRGICATDDGYVFMGEYVMNLDRSHPIMLYRSANGGRTFETILEFPRGDIRHIHFVQWDPFEGALWMGTGDADQESRLYKSTDKGESWQLVGGGSQLWRAVGVAFRAEALYWGTDAGSDAGTHPNYIVRFDRRSQTVQTLLEIQGPCHGSATLNDGTIAISTGIEGGINESGKAAHLWISNDGISWSEVVRFAKDLMPYLLQYGVLRFPAGLEKSGHLAFTGMGLRGAGEKVFLGHIPEVR
jgi:hypothetical protein